jgi:hypothetical protein
MFLLDVTLAANEGRSGILWVGVAGILRIGSQCTIATGRLDTLAPLMVDSFHRAGMYPGILERVANGPDGTAEQ